MGKKKKDTKPKITAYPTAEFKRVFYRESKRRGTTQSKFALYLIGLGWEVLRQRQATGGREVRELPDPPKRTAKRVDAVDIRPAYGTKK